MHQAAVWQKSAASKLIRLFICRSIKLTSNVFIILLSWVENSSSFRSAGIQILWVHFSAFCWNRYYLWQDMHSSAEAQVLAGRSQGLEEEGWDETSANPSRLRLANVWYQGNEMGLGPAKQTGKSCVPTSLQRPVSTIRSAVEGSTMFLGNRAQSEERGGLCVYANDAWCSNAVKADGRCLPDVRPLIWRRNHNIIISWCIYVLYM